MPNFPNYPNYTIVNKNGSIGVNAGIDWGDDKLTDNKCVCPHCNCRLYKETDIEKEKSQLSDIVSMMTLRGFPIKSLKEIAATVLKALLSSDAEVMQLKEENNGLRALIGDKLFKPPLVMTLLNKLGYSWERGPKEKWWKGGPMNIKQAEAIVKQTLNAIDKDPELQKTIKGYIEKDLEEKTKALHEEFEEKLKRADSQIAVKSSMPSFNGDLYQLKNAYTYQYTPYTSGPSGPSFTVACDPAIAGDTILFTNPPSPADILTVKCANTDTYGNSAINAVINNSAVSNNDTIRTTT